MSTPVLALRWRATALSRLFPRRCGRRRLWNRSRLACAGRMAGEALGHGRVHCAGRVRAVVRHGRAGDGGRWPFPPNASLPGAQLRGGIPF